jgi:hypothetical protein
MLERSIFRKHRVRIKIREKSKKLGLILIFKAEM